MGKMRWIYGLTVKERKMPSSENCRDWHSPVSVVIKEEKAREIN